MSDQIDACPACGGTCVPPVCDYPGLPPVTTVTAPQRKAMLDRAVKGGQNRADAERLLDQTLREAGPGTLDARLNYEGFGSIPATGDRDG